MISQNDNSDEDLCIKEMGTKDVVLYVDERCVTRCERSKKIFKYSRNISL